MFDDIGSDGRAPDAGESLQISALLGFGGLISPDIAEVGSARGTIDASVEAVERSFYGKQSDTVINGAPVTALRPSSASGPSRLCAKDLVAELNLINRQIHRIMFQVDRAVTRLGTIG